MADPYDLCPCGSGKKFKWCCQAIHQTLAQAFTLDEQGQHDQALKLLDDVVAQHPDNPEAWGRKAQILYQNERVEDAEQALEKALTLNPQYAFGTYLRGRFRFYEGELPGALILYRKAADLYPADAAQVLADLYVDIFDCEMKLNHPVAAHAAAELAVRLSPANDKLRTGVATVFGAENRNLPDAAKTKYRYRPLPADASAERKTAWASALRTIESGKLADAVRAFEQLTRDDADNRAAWYNLALSQAWLGNNHDALAALERYVTLEPDLAHAAEAWALGEVLRLGQGAEDEADIVEHSLTVALRDPKGFVGILGEMEHERQLVGTQISQEEGILTAVIVEEPGPALTPELQARQNPKLAAYIVMMGNIVRFWNVNPEPLQRMIEKLRTKAVGMMEQPIASRGPAKFNDVLSEAVTFPRNAVSEEDARNRVQEGVERYLEETWLHRSLKSLGGVPPVDAAGHPVLRKKLAGVIQFLQDCATVAHLPYDFERLRRKLGLVAGSTPVAAPTPAGLDIGAMGAAELANLGVEALSEVELEQAFQTALKVDARELAGKFASTLIARPARTERADRYPLYNHLVQQAVAQGDVPAALDFVNAGESDDCSHNEGRRRNDYELRRAQLLARSGETTPSRDAFDRLIARAPTLLRFRVSAAEAMLSARQAADAHRYAQEGHAEAIKQNDRDTAEHFKELLAAAQKQGG